MSGEFEKAYRSWNIINDFPSNPLSICARELAKCHEADMQTLTKENDAAIKIMGNGNRKRDDRISWLEEYANAKDISVTEEMQRANEAEARITELEAQVQDLIEELIEELQDVVCFASECTTSKEYAVKRLKELTEKK